MIGRYTTGLRGLRDCLFYIMLSRSVAGFATDRGLADRSDRAVVERAAELGVVQLDGDVRNAPLRPPRIPYGCACGVIAVLRRAEEIALGLLCLVQDV